MHCIALFFSKSTRMKLSSLREQLFSFLRLQVLIDDDFTLLKTITYTITI